ncbi:MAG: hypothetical protein KAT00_12060, partial [Planctomycetes bacterium]|nr:hypothetical protein [Planctomycetota bacterium]
LSGKKITRKAKENPSRPESKRGKAWGVITDGMTYEAYREAGGNAFDLNFFIGKGYATVK